MISWRAPCRDTTRAARRDAAQEMGHTSLRKGGYNLALVRVA